MSKYTTSEVLGWGLLGAAALGVFALITRGQIGSGVNTQLYDKNGNPVSQAQAFAHPGTYYDSKGNAVVVRQNTLPAPGSTDLLSQLLGTFNLPNVVALSTPSPVVLGSSSTGPKCVRITPVVQAGNLGGDTLHIQVIDSDGNITSDRYDSTGFLTPLEASLPLC